MKRIGFHTLGCKLNQYETDAIAADFSRAGYEIVPFDAEADAYVINTCTVTNKSDRKSRNIIHRARRQLGEPVVVVTGCFADSAAKELESMPGVTYVVENAKKTHLFPLLDGHFRGEIKPLSEMESDFFNFSLPQDLFHTRAMVKIQDGCDNFCTFCIIPFVRGRAKSRPSEEIFQNIRELIASGYKEIVLTGVNMSRYLSAGITFEDLLLKILEIPGDFRLRISSLEPEGLGEKFLSALDHPKMCPHLHLCIQSGSEKVLLKMRREYGLDEYHQLVQKIRNRIPDFNITTDILFGFPGETEDDLSSTLEVIKELRFGHIHLFPYSKRKGTRAERMENQIPNSEKKRRSNILAKIGEEIKQDVRASFIGKRQRVLLEKVEEEFAFGYGEHYLPIKIPAKSTWEKNSWLDVQITGMEAAQDPRLIGEPLKN